MGKLVGYMATAFIISVGGHWSISFYIEIGALCPVVYYILAVAETKFL